MDTVPKPSCPWNERQEQENKKNNRTLILGILVAAVSLAAVSGVNYMFQILIINLFCIFFVYFSYCIIWSLRNQTKYKKKRKKSLPVIVSFLLIFYNTSVVNRVKFILIDPNTDSKSPKNYSPVPGLLYFFCDCQIN